MKDTFPVNEENSEEAKDLVKERKEEHALVHEEEID